MKYECLRCGAVENTTNPPHLCKDLKARLNRQEQAVALVLGEIAILRTKHSPINSFDGVDCSCQSFHEDDWWEHINQEEFALAIIKRIGGRDLGV